METLYNYINNANVLTDWDGHIHLFNHKNPIPKKFNFKKCVGFMDIEYDSKNINVLDSYTNYIENHWDKDKEILLATGITIEDIESVYEAAIMKQMAATKEDADDTDDVDDTDDTDDSDELSDEENEELESLVDDDLDDVELTDTMEMEPVVVPETQTVPEEPEDTEHPEIISLDDDEELL